MPSSTCNHHRFAFPRCRWEWIFFQDYDDNMFFSIRGEKDDHMSDPVRSSIYLIYPRYTNWEKLWEKEEKIAAGGDKRGPNAGRKVGAASKILVEFDVGFAASVIKRGADKPGAESGNPIWCFTNELTYGAFEGRYSKGGKHLTAASSAGKFTMMYGIDPTKMAAHLKLGKRVSLDLFDPSSLHRLGETGKSRISC